MKTILLLTVLMTIQFSQANDVLWKNNRITADQPFPAKVVGVATSWVGYELLLEEVGSDSPRYCYVNVAMTFPLKYVVTTKDKSPKLLINTPKSKWTKIDPGILVSKFNYEAGGLYKLGSKYGKNDLLLAAVANTKK